ncbi:MAG: hypothetical protein R3C59_28725 [Planctomycetaceae bacterium]
MGTDELVVAPNFRWRIEVLVGVTQKNTYSATPTWREFDRNSAEDGGVSFNPTERMAVCRSIGHPIWDTEFLYIDRDFVAE